MFREINPKLMDTKILKLLPIKGSEKRIAKSLFCRVYNQIAVNPPTISHA